MRPLCHSTTVTKTDRAYALDEIVEATRYVETGQKTGNVVLCVSEAAPGAQPERATKQEDEVPA